MAMSYTELVIKKVTPGKPSRYISDDTKETPTEVPVPRKPIVVDPLKHSVSALFSLYIKQIKITQTCNRYINSKLPGEKFLKIYYKYRNFEQDVQSPESLLDNMKLELEFNITYNLDVTEEFLESHDENPVRLKLFAVDDKTEVPLSTAEMDLADILTVVNQKDCRRVTLSNDDIDPRSPYIALLDLCYKFSCNKKHLRDVYTVWQNSKAMQRSTSRILSINEFYSASGGRSTESVAVTHSEADQFADDLFLVLSRNKVLKTSQTDINNTLEERVRWLRYEANWKQTLQENAILHGKDPHEVAWRQWREEDTGNVKLRTYDKLKPIEYKPEFCITIKQLYFLDGSPPLIKESVKHVYVEYSFLGEEGPEMESPFSLPKGTIDSPTVFNWRKTFHIDLKYNMPNCRKLAELIKHNEIIKFVVISEPLEDPEIPIQTCEEIGYAEVPLEEVIQLEENSDTYEYEIVDFFNPIAVIGYMTIRFDGILAMRKMALTLMAPQGYKLFM